MTDHGSYSQDFYNQSAGGMKSSAECIVPYIVKTIEPLSVLDVGCGEGLWLSEFIKEGVTDVVGLDGDYVRRDKLQISEELFCPTDLASHFDIGREFSLVISLEVAEHLDASRAEGFVECLTRHGKVVLFSAAIPFQGGTHHVNLQWQDYWVELFDKYDYAPIDAIRPIFWNNQNVEFWYRQNTLLFVSRDILADSPIILRARDAISSPIHSVVHPEFFNIIAGRGPTAEQLEFLTFGAVLPRIPAMIKRSFYSRIGRK